jgi:GR25 family glycosyltransferase involved in LPS biosynthesis
MLRVEEDGHRRYHHQLSRGAVGCYCSHVQALRLCRSCSEDR